MDLGHFKIVKKMLQNPQKSEWKIEYYLHVDIWVEICHHYCRAFFGLCGFESDP